MNEKKLNFVKLVIFYLRKFNITGEVAVFIAAQFALESNYGTSKLAQEFGNYCGMKLPVVRRTTATNFGSHDKWASFDSLQDCVCDFVLCLQFRKPMAIDFESIGHYKHFIKGWYCPESTYLDKINSIYSQLQIYLKNGN